MNKLQTFGLLAVLSTLAAAGATVPAFAQNILGFSGGPFSGGTISQGGAGLVYISNDGLKSFSTCASAIGRLEITGDASAEMVETGCSAL